MEMPDVVVEKEDIYKGLKISEEELKKKNKTAVKKSQKLSQNKEPCE